MWVGSCGAIPNGGDSPTLLGCHPAPLFPDYPEQPRGIEGEMGRLPAPSFPDSPKLCTLKSYFHRFPVSPIDQKLQLYDERFPFGFWFLVSGYVIGMQYA